MEFEDWISTTWGAVSELKYGKSLKNYKNNKVGSPVFGTNGQIGYTDSPLTTGPGIIVGRKGAYRGIHYSNQDFYVIDTAYYLEVNKEIIDIRWAYYELITKDINSLDSGSAIPSTKREDFYAVKVKIPPLSVQRKIVKILDSLDSKIRLNSKIITNAEQLAQTLFKRWFVDFEFPNEDGEPYKSNGGEMVESELGMIPAEWSVGTLDNIGTIVGGGTPSKKVADYYTSNGYSWITPKDLSNDRSLYIYRGSIDITDIALNKGGAKLHPENTVLFSSRAPIGYVAIAGQKVATNQGFKSIIPKEDVPSEYVFLLLKCLTPIIESNASGSTFKEISGAGMKGIKTIIPRSANLSEFKEVITPLFKKIKETEKEIKNLTALRDTLLPKLLSGEIELHDETEVPENVPVS